MTESYRKKLIEVALPLDVINEASSKEKSVRHGNISTMHLWWSRKPLAASKAVLFSSIIDDPGNYLPEKEADTERKRLFNLIQEFIKWKNPNSKAAHKRAISMIKPYLDKSTFQVFDPFVGGGSIPLAAQYLGIEGYGIDVNPVATIISKCLVEIPPKFNSRPPVNKSSRFSVNQWTGARGLAEDLRYYGKRLNEIAYQRIGDKFSSNREGETVVAWIWCRSVSCPNPACGIDIPLLTSFYLKKKKGEYVHVVPNIRKHEISFEIRTSSHFDEDVAKGTSAGRASFRCVNLGCETPVKGDYIDDQANMNKVKFLGVAVVTEGKRSRNYRSFTDQDYELVNSIDRRKLLESAIVPTQKCEGTFASNAQGRDYGFHNFSDYFTSRQLLLMTTMIDSLDLIKKEIDVDTNDDEYKRGLLTYLAIVISKSSDYYNSLTLWNNQGEKIEHLFVSQGINMAWNFAEANPFSHSSKNFLASLELTAEAVEVLPTSKKGEVRNLDSIHHLNFEKLNPIISTDPPYYDNINYSKLSDFFYIWLRPMLKGIYPDLFSTILTPREGELSADRYRYGGDENRAKENFTKSIQEAFLGINKHANKEFPITIYYAFKQTQKETDLEGELYASTGWEAMLTGLINANLRIVGTWPMRTERTSRISSIGANSLASSIVVVCRIRDRDAPISTRREFIKALKEELPQSLSNLKNVDIAPVDLAQSAIGPGMAIFSRYSEVLEADGKRMNVRSALQIINQELDSYFAEKEFEMDQETRFCIAWYEQFAWNDGPFGLAEGLMKAQNTAVNSLISAGVIIARSGKVRLIKRSELKENWDPSSEKTLTVWSLVQYLSKTLEENGEDRAAEILKKVNSKSESIKNLAYRLYTLAEKKGWGKDALSYNNIITSWQSISDKAIFGVGHESSKNAFKDDSQSTLDDV